MLTAHALAELITQGESETVEFKKGLPPTSILARHLTAFANTKGGTLIMGVSHGGRIVGLLPEEVALAVHTLRRVAESLFSWAIDVGSVELNGKHLVYATVDPAPRHMRPVLTASGELYERVGGNLRKLTEQEEIRSINPDSFEPASRSRSCVVFVAMSFRDEEEPALADYFNAMRRAVQRAELPIILMRLDLVDGDYEISQEIMDQIDRADLVIADFTLGPKNVYFELGYARGRRKSVIQTARKGEVLEFDVRNWRTTFYRNATELEDKLVAELTAAYSKMVAT